MSRIFAQRMSHPNTSTDGSERTRPVRRDIQCTDMATKSTLFELMGKAHTIAILHEFAVEPDPWRFNELKDRLNISPNTLSERLSELVDAELVARHPYNEIPPRVEYEATPKARELESVFEDLHDWMLRHEH